MERGVGLPGGASPAVDGLGDGEGILVGLGCGGLTFRLDFRLNFCLNFCLDFCLDFRLNYGDGEGAAERGELGLGERGIAAEPAVDGVEDGGMRFVLEGGAEAGEMSGEGLRGNAKLAGMLEAVGVHEHAMVAIGDAIGPLAGDVGVENEAAGGCATGNGEAAA